MSSAPHGTILVTGGTGKVGLILTKLLEAASIPFLAASRFSSGVVHGVRFDWLDRDTWDEVFAATTTKDQPPVIAVFLIAPSVVESSPIMNDFVDLARDKYGVKRFVLLSATVIEAGGMAMGGTAGYLAELGEKGEIEWGIMRPTWFQGMQCPWLDGLQIRQHADDSMIDNWAEQDNLHKSIKAEGKCYSAAGDGKIPWVSKHDIAACAFCALTAEKPVNGDLIILGPELLSHSDVSSCVRNIHMGASLYS